MKNWERKRGKNIIYGFRDKKQNEQSFHLRFLIYYFYDYSPRYQLPLNGFCLMEESQAHFLTASDHPKWQSAEQKYLEENKPMPIIVLQIWMITWSYKELSIQERKQSPQDMFRHIIYIFTCHQKAERVRAVCQASTIRLGINELKSLLAIEKHWFLKTNSR